MYDELLDDPKVQRLSGDDFKGWVNLLCLMSRGSANLSDENDIAFALRIDLRKAKAMIGRLIDAGLIIKSDQGFEPYKWNERQYKSDVSTARVKRFRERSKIVSETPPDTDTDKSIPLAKANGAEPANDESADAVFWATAKAYVGGKNAGSLIGKWVKQIGKAETAQVITRAQLERPVEKIAFIEGCVRQIATKARAQDAWVSPC
jgi:hypothetical protein